MNANLVAALQREQQLHDELVHRDILALPFERRMAHMALHFAKYTGQLIAMRTVDRLQLERTIVDTTIICLACANALSLQLDRQLESGAEIAPNVRAGYCTNEPTTSATLPVWLGTHMAVQNARIAKACEAFDHREDYPYQEALSAGVVGILRVAMRAAEVMSLDLTSEVRSRWAGIENRLLKRPSSNSILPLAKTA